MNEEELLNYLKELVINAGTQRKLANELGISQVYLSDILKGRRTIGKSVLDKLKIKKIINYEQGGYCG